MIASSLAKRSEGRINKKADSPVPYCFILDDEYKVVLAGPSGTADPLAGRYSVGDPTDALPERIDGVRALPHGDVAGYAPERDRRGAGGHVVGYARKGRLARARRGLAGHAPELVRISVRRRLAGKCGTAARVRWAPHGGLRSAGRRGVCVALLSGA